MSRCGLCPAYRQTDTVARASENRGHPFNLAGIFLQPIIKDQSNTLIKHSSLLLIKTSFSFNKLADHISLPATLFLKCQKLTDINVRKRLGQTSHLRRHSPHICPCLVESPAILSDNHILNSIIK